jgi:Rha family phage regulatory protein
MEDQLNVFMKGNNLYTDSREVAKMVGKRHDHLVRDIRGYIKILNQSLKLDTDDFFKKSNYKAGTGKIYPCYLITEIGCELIANEMTGEKGILFTIECMNAFHSIEEKLKEHNQDMLVLPKNYSSALRVLADKVDENSNLKETNAQQQQVVEEQNPEINYYDVILSSKDAVSITQIAKDYGKTAQWMNEFLHKHKVQFKQGKTWLLYKDYAAQGYTKSETIPYDKYDGETGTAIHTKWTQKGRLFIYDLLKKYNVLPLIDIDNVKERS